ncbi:MAG TPA: ABC transporter permease [Streptosporangiaceae bacterium]|nr:ABC transporter permease [Streptosporangiaceae bacterium]
MIWLTWRQFRPQAIVAAGALVVVAILLAASRASVGGAYTASGLSACHANCSTLVATFLLDLNPLDRFLWLGSILLMYLTPVAMGAFWGAPLIAREFEAGTHRLAWNQSVTRTRWTFVKLGLVGLASCATAGLLSLMWTWWAGPIDSAASFLHGQGHVNVAGANAAFGLTRLDPVMFAARGVAPVGYAAFAFALGVTAGVLLRRTLAAMAVTLVIFIAIQVLVPNLVRPHLLPPVQVTTPLTARNLTFAVNENLNVGHSTVQVSGPNFAQPGAWLISDVTVTSSGAAVVTPKACQFTLAELRNAGPGAELLGCRKVLGTMRLRQIVSYEPASRFWPLQWIETGLYLVLAAGLGLVCGWQVRRRRVP